MLSSSFLNGNEGGKPTLYLDSVNLQLMSNLKIPGKESPLMILQDKLFQVPFSQENLLLFSQLTSLQERQFVTYPEESTSADDSVTHIAEEAPSGEVIDRAEESETNSPVKSPPQKDPEEATYHFLIEDAPSGEYTFDAINNLQTQLSAALIEEGYYGIAVTVDPDQIDIETGEDYRAEEDTSLNLKIWLGEVIKSRTIAKGNRIKGDNPINHPFHQKIISNDPFVGSDEDGRFLIDKGAVDNYVMRLNQNSRRRVDIALSSGGAQADIILDYVVSESKPWTVYLQVSNTGTEATGEWRERAGVVHHQLTNNDDVLHFDYLTAEFDRANAVLTSYEYPLIGPDYLKLYTYFKYSDFAAENLVVPSLADSEGETYSFGGELVYTPFYLKEHAFSAMLGFLTEDIEFQTSGRPDPGNVNLFSPYFRLEAKKNKQLHQSSFSISYEENIKTADDDDANLQNLGRLDSSIDHRILNFDIYQTFFIEPLLPSYYKVKPDKWLANSLVHEFAFSFSRQEAFDNVRLITQKQFYGGGFFTVRGYNESAARGDSGHLGSAEYRIHLARLLRPASMLKEIDAEEQVPERKVRNQFNYRAPSLYGVPDWDFLVRYFFDWGSFTFNDNDDQSDEVNQNMQSTGIGFEFQYKSNLNIRLDYGIVLEELADFNDGVADDADEGDSRFHFLATYSF